MPRKVGSSDEIHVEAPPRVTVDELLALRKSIDAIIAADSIAGRAAAALSAVELVDRELDQGGVTVVHGFVVKHGSTFNERTGEIDGVPAPGDRVWSKATGWTEGKAPSVPDHIFVVSKNLQA